MGIFSKLFGKKKSEAEGTMPRDPMGDMTQANAGAPARTDMASTSSESSNGGASTPTGMESPSDQQSQM